MDETDYSDYADGRTAALYKVDVRPAAGGIAIRGQGVSAFWPADGLEIIDAPDNESTMRLGHAAYPAARLTISDPALQARILSTFPQAQKNRRDGRRRDMKRVVWAGGIVASLVALFFLALPSIVSTVAALVPYSMEKSLGDSAYSTFGQLIDGADQVCIEPEGYAVLTGIVAKITRGMDLSGPVDVQVVPSDIVNAVAFPGGRILVFDGLVQQAESPEEVAGVIAHEIGHAHHRHGVEGMIRSSFIDAVISIVAPGSAGDVGASLGSTLLNQSYGRDAEREADAFAITHLNRIGVRTHGMAAFFERIGVDEKSNRGFAALQYLSSHPASSERSETIRSQGTADGDIVSDQDWRKLRTICKTIDE